MLLLMCFMPETPRFLLSQHKRQEASAALQFLWGPGQHWEEPPIEDENQVKGGTVKHSQRKWGTMQYIHRGGPTVPYPMS